MALDTYANLQASIAAWIDRQDMTSVIPDFITLFETTANAELPLRTRFNVSTTTLSTVAGTSTVALPSDFLEAKALINQTTPVKVISPYTAAALYTTVTNPASVGPPAGYTFTGTNIELAPVPDQVYSLKLYYYSKVPALTDSATTNWLLTNFPNLYLFGSLISAEAYLGTDPRIKLWGDLYDNLVQKLNLSNERGEYGGTPVSVRVDSVA